MDDFSDVEKPSEILNENYTFEKLNPNEVTAKWNDSYLFSSREAALKELKVLKEIRGAKRDFPS